MQSSAESGNADTATIGKQDSMEEDDDDIQESTPTKQSASISGIMNPTDSLKREQNNNNNNNNNDDNNNNDNNSNQAKNENVQIQSTTCARPDPACASAHASPKSEPETPGNPGESAQQHTPGNEPGEHKLHATISKLLGVPLLQWPYSEASLMAMVELKTEQERAKAEKLHRESLQCATRLLDQAHSYGVPATLLPYLFVTSKDDEHEISRRISAFQSQQLLRGGSLNTSIGGSKSELSSPVSGLGISTPGFRYSSQGRLGNMGAHTGEIPDLRPASVGGNTPTRAQVHTTRAGSAPGVTRSQSFSPSHQRSHTISSMVGATSVWKVNIPQQQQFQFHHWSGPTNSKGKAPGERLSRHASSPGNSRSGSSASGSGRPSLANAASSGESIPTTATTATATAAAMGSSRMGPTHMGPAGTRVGTPPMGSTTASRTATRTVPSSSHKSQRPSESTQAESSQHKVFVKGHTRAVSKDTARMREENNLDNDTSSLSLVSETAEPDTSLKRKREAEDQEQDAHEALVASRRGLHVHTESITVRAAAGASGAGVSPDRASPGGMYDRRPVTLSAVPNGHKRSRSEVAPVYSAQGPYMYWGAAGPQQPKAGPGGYYPNQAAPATPAGPPPAYTGYMSRVPSTPQFQFFPQRQPAPGPQQQPATAQAPGQLVPGQSSQAASGPPGVPGAPMGRAPPPPGYYYQQPSAPFYPQQTPYRFPPPSPYAVSPQRNSISSAGSQPPAGARPNPTNYPRHRTSPGIS